jgi:hypothetical protein
MPTVRAFRSGDEAGVCRLFEQVHRRPLPEAVWRWRYAPQPEGAPVITVAEDGGAVVGHVASLPVTLQRGPDARRAGLWVDLMIAKEARGLDLFMELCEANRRACREAGWDLVFAFPNNNSFPLLKRMLDWRDIGDIRSLEGPLSALKEPAAAPAREATGFEPELAALWEKTRPKDSWAVKRAPQRIAWRYRGRPGGDYRVWMVPGGGWLAAKTFNGPRGKVGDILELWADDAAAPALLSAALGYFREQVVETVSAWMPEHAPHHRRLLSLGLTPSGDITHFAARPTADAAAGFPARREDWIVVKGDSDVF